MRGFTVRLISTMNSIPPDQSAGSDIGLCLKCRYVDLIRSDRGAVFYRCQRSASDPGFAKYPPLPVLRCAGHQAKTEVPIPAADCD